MKNKLNTNELDELGDEMSDTEPEGSPIHKDKPEEEGFKEMCSIKYKDGSETQIASSSVSVERLCELAHLIKLNLLNDVSKKIPNYFG